MTQNVVGLFLQAAERHGQRRAFVVPSGEAVLFAELRQRVEAFAGGLIAAGFERGERAVFMLSMSPELYVAVLGTLAAGGVATFVDPWIPLREIARLAAHAKPALFVGTPKAHLLRLLAPELRGVRLTVATDAFGARLAARYRFGSLRGAPRVASVADDAAALITYTTGSSGTPKGVRRTHAILSAQHTAIRDEFPARDDDVDLTTFPVFALSNLASGVTTLIPPVDLRRVANADPRKVLAALRHSGATTASASPPLFDLLSDHVTAAGETAPPLRRIVTGGAAVRDDQLRRWRSAFPATEILVAYGSSEAEPVARMSADERLALGAEPGTRHTRPVGGAGYCVGTPVAAVRTRVVRIERGTLARPIDAQPGTVGELLVTGAHVCRDYDGDAEGAAFAENKVRDADGTIWHRMGDTGYVDRRGRFWLVGRVHSTIRRDGVDVHAQVVEQAARASDARIRRVAALGIPDARLGERVAIVVESDDEGVAADVRDRLAASKDAPVDDVIVTRAPLPVDPRHNSKIDYARLRRMLLDGALQ